MLIVKTAALIFFSHFTMAAIEPNFYVKKHDQVPFYKSPSSLFSSGSASLDKLKKQLVKSQNNTEKFYEWNKIYFDEDELMPLFATHLSRYVIENETGRRLKVNDTNARTLLVFDEKINSTKKLLLNEVQADAYDLGFAMTLKDSYLRSASTEPSSIKTTIPQGTRLLVENYMNGFALVRYQNYTGFINLNEMISKFDLASFVFANNSWHQVEKRISDHIRTKNGVKISLNKIRGIITPKEIGIIASHSQKIPIWSKVKTTKANIIRWQQSLIKGQGLVWWKPNREFEKLYFTVDEILKRNISSASFHPQNPYRGIVSANGVFVTQNGYHWRKLPQFEDYNGPVHFFSDSLMFVGNFKSIDGGNNFESYIQIDKLAAAVEDQYGFAPKILQVKKIETPTPLKIKIEIDTGFKRIKLESPLLTQNWKPSRT
jgi:hypothetical protein